MSIIAWNYNFRSTDQQQQLLTAVTRETLFKVPHYRPAPIRHHSAKTAAPSGLRAKTLAPTRRRPAATIWPLYWARPLTTHASTRHKFYISISRLRQPPTTPPPRQQQSNRTFCTTLTSGAVLVPRTMAAPVPQRRQLRRRTSSRRSTMWPACPASPRTPVWRTALATQSLVRVSIYFLICSNF